MHAEKFRPDVDLDTADYEGEEFYSRLIKLPLELQKIHLQRILTANMSDSDANTYLDKILTERKEATTVTVVSDKSIETIFERNKSKILQAVETTVFHGPDIGNGSTARIKRFDINDDVSLIPMAIKYIVTPNPTTLSATKEHDVLKEVERIKAIEEIESQKGIKGIRVPHPYFHHKTSRLQCYGMELIDGYSLKMVLEDDVSDEKLNNLRVSFQRVSQDEIYSDIEKFFSTMHSYCLHGDVKPANIMVGMNGVIYIIDFGQSILVNDIPEDGRAQLDDHKEEEIKKAKLIIRTFIKKLFATKS